jgi:hypothetical protein
MTPEEFNALMSAIVNGLRGAPEIESVALITQADSTGTEPEIAVNVGGQDLVLVASPL